MLIFNIILEILGGTALVLGGSVLMIGTLGLIRLADVYQRMHASGIIDTGGAGLILFGLLLLAPDWSSGIRIILIGIILVFTSPTATHAIARAAHSENYDPKIKIKPNKTKNG